MPANDKPNDKVLAHFVNTVPTLVTPSRHNVQDRGVGGSLEQVAGVCCGLKMTLHCCLNGQDRGVCGSLEQVAGECCGLNRGFDKPTEVNTKSSQRLSLH